MQLDAVDAPAGEMTVVLGPGWPGILLHEAVGHGLEADFNRKGVSAFSGRIGQQVASPLCTVIDDGTIAQPPRLAQRGRRRPSHAAQCADRERRAARLSAGQAFQPPDAAPRPPAAAAAKATQHIPMPRMTNTFMLAGESDPEEIIRSVPQGPLLRQLRRRPGGYHQRQLRVLGRRRVT